MSEESRQHPSGSRPNIVVVLADDMGFSDIGCYGGEIPTPNLDRLRSEGVAMSQFYNTARCCPSRASLLTGLHPHQTGIGILTRDDRPVGYAGTLNDRCVTIAEAVRDGGYATYMSGKWHVTGRCDTPDETWPLGRGFDHFFGTCNGGGNYWWPSTLTRDESPLGPHDCPDDFFYTDAIADSACDFITEHARRRAQDPFLCYVAFTAPHWPLHAREEDIAAHQGRYDEGWDVLRVRREARQAELGLFENDFPAGGRDPEVPAWADVEEREWQTRRMEVYAAQVATMDAGIGRILDALDETGRRDDTLVMFLSDNGGCAEGQPVGWGKSGLNFRQETPDGRPVRRGNIPDIMPGPADTFVSYGRSWANLSNTPFREYKHWVHEGGIATPLVVRWPQGGLQPGVVRHQPHQLTDVMATVLDVAGLSYPSAFGGVQRLAPEGVSMLDTWRGGTAPDRYLFWEHEGNAACRRGRWKLVRKFPADWELYDIDVDRAEMSDVAANHPGVVTDLVREYDEWAQRCGVLPREDILQLYAARADG